MRQRGETVEEARRRYCEANAGFLGQESRDRGGITGVLFMTEGQDSDARGLRHTAKIGNRNARHAVDRVQAVELERIDDEVEAVGQLPLFRVRRGVGFYCSFSHWRFPLLNPDSRRTFPRGRQGRARGRGPVLRHDRSIAPPVLR